MIGKVRWLSAFALILAGGLPGAAGAEPVSIALHLSGQAQAADVAFGQGAGMSPMAFDSTHKVYATTVQVSDVRPVRYALRLQYGSESYLLPLRLHKYSGRIELMVHFDAPRFCRDSLVRQAETPAQENNIEQALAKYLLAAHLSRLDDEAGKCRGTQPNRLAKARILRGIQLANFYSSPFLPPEGDRATWADLLGARTAAAYASQVASTDAILMDAARIEAQSDRDYGAAAEINGALLDDVRENEDKARAYAGVGLNEGLLTRNQDYLETMAGTVEPVEASDGPG